MRWAIGGAALVLGACGTDGTVATSAASSTSASTSIIASSTTTTTTTAVSSSGEGGSTSGSSSSSSGSGGAGGGAACTARPAPRSGRGYVYGANSAPTTSSTATAAMVAQADNTCVVETCGTCTVTQCSLDPFALPPPKNAGSISLTGGVRDVTLNVLGDGTYDWAATYSTTSLLFGGGETITIDAAGSADIPAFTHALVAPSTLQLVSPDLSNPTLSKTTDLALTWTGASTGEAIVSITTNVGGSPIIATSLSCRFDVAAGAGVVPADVLQRLSDTSEGLFQFAAISNAQVQPGGWDLDVGLSAVASSASSTSGAADVGSVDIH